MRKGGILRSLLGRPGKPLSGFSLERQKRAYGACRGLLGRAGQGRSSAAAEMLAPGPLSRAELQAEVVERLRVADDHTRKHNGELRRENARLLGLVPERSACTPTTSAPPRSATACSTLCRTTNSGSSTSRRRPIAQVSLGLPACGHHGCDGQMFRAKRRFAGADIRRADVAVASAIPRCHPGAMGLASGAESPALGRGCRTSHGRRRSLSCRIKPYGSAPLSTACGNNEPGPAYY